MACGQDQRQCVPVFYQEVTACVPNCQFSIAMPYNREALVYTNEYWETWIEREMPELLGLPTEESAE